MFKGHFCGTAGKNVTCNTGTQYGCHLCLGCFISSNLSNNGPKKSSGGLPNVWAPATHVKLQAPCFGAASKRTGTLWDPGTCQVTI